MRSSTAEILLSRSFLLSFFSFFFVWISFDFFILFPLYIIDRGGNSVDVGFQTAIFFFPAVLIRPVAGWLTDRIGRLKVLWFGSGLMVITGFVFLLFEGDYQEIKWMIALNLWLRGMAFAAFYTAFFTYVVDLTTFENRARIIGLFGVSGLIAHALAPRLAEIVLEKYGFSGYFTATGLLSLVSLSISVTMKETRTISRTTERGLSIIKKVIFSGRNLVILPGAFAFGYVVASFNTFGAPYFAEAGDASVGYFFLVYGSMAGLIRIVFGGIADRYTRWKLVAIFFTLQSLGMAIIVLKPVADWYLFSAAICGAAHGILFPSMTAMAIDAHPEEYRGVVTSIFTATMELGFSLGSYFLGVLVAFYGYVVMFLSASFLAILFTGYVLAIQLKSDKKSCS